MAVRARAARHAGLLFDVAVNGTHPLLPWLAFFCAGIVLGRVLHTSWWRPVAIAGGLTLFGLATVLGAADGVGRRGPCWRAPTRSAAALLYTASALGHGAGRRSAWSRGWPSASPARRLVALAGDAGAMSLTLYVAHALVFNLVVDWLGWIRPTGLDTALLFAAAYWVVAIAAARGWWHRRFGDRPGRVAVPPPRRLTGSASGRRLQLLERGAAVGSPVS